MKDDTFRPVFIGGTGRSGTSVMAKFLNTHKDCTLPTHENKLIVETRGLRSVVDGLSSGFDWLDNHHTISNFVEYSEILRKPGFRSELLKILFRFLRVPSKLLSGKKLDASVILRFNPNIRYSHHAVGRTLGYAHYDRCVEQFKRDIILDEDTQGVLDTEGLIKPLYTSRTSDRRELIIAARSFVDALCAPSLADSGSAVWCDDTPLNVQYSDFLLEVYPNAAIVHMVRHPLDVLASYLEQTWASDDVERTLLRLSRFYETLIKVHESPIGQNILKVKLENMCHDYETQKNLLCDFCGLSRDGFDGTVTFAASRIDSWREKLPTTIHGPAREKLGFAIDYFDYA